MIDTIYSYGNEVVMVRVKGKIALFSMTGYNEMFAPIDGLQLNRSGVIKQFPDLKDKDDWNKIAIKRFKKHMQDMDSEMQITIYISKELKKCGYVPLFRQREGFRKQKL